MTPGDMFVFNEDTSILWIVFVTLYSIKLLDLLYIDSFSSRYQCQCVVKWSSNAISTWTCWSCCFVSTKSTFIESSSSCRQIYIYIFPHPVFSLINCLWCIHLLKTKMTFIWLFNPISFILTRVYHAVIEYRVLAPLFKFGLL